MDKVVFSVTWQDNRCFPGSYKNRDCLLLFMNKKYSSPQFTILAEILLRCVPCHVVLFGIKLHFQQKMYRKYRLLVINESVLKPKKNRQHILNPYRSPALHSRCKSCL